jgi:hypothetical protein
VHEALRYYCISGDAVERKGEGLVGSSAGAIVGAPARFFREKLAELHLRSRVSVLRCSLRVEGTRYA